MLEPNGNKGKSVAVITGTRAEFGLLRPVINLLKDKGLSVKLIVTGSHLAESMGNTVSEIIAGGYQITEKIDILENDPATSMTTAFSRAFSGFAEYYKVNHTDMTVLLGDRYETLAAALAAFMADVPIAHISGGDITEGAKDDAFRHCITKLSMLHFPSTERGRERVIQLGESPDRVYAVGSLGAENTLKLPVIPEGELSNQIGFDFGMDFLLVTYHPETLGAPDAKTGINQLLLALDNFAIPVLFTKSNVDDGGAAINSTIENYCQNRIGCKLVSSLGEIGYLSAMRYARAVVGNSSSAIIEAPCLKIPAVNIGERQSGREMGTNVINCAGDSSSIYAAITKAISEDFNKEMENIYNPYIGTCVAEKITCHIVSFLQNDNETNQKTFFDVSFLGDNG